MANNFRAEADIELGGELRTMRLTYNAIAQIESAGVSLLVLSEQLSNVTIKVTDMVRIVTTTLNEVRVERKEKLLTDRDVGMWIMDEGIMKLHGPVHLMLMRAYVSSQRREEMQLGKVVKTGEVTPTPDSTGETT